MSRAVELTLAALLLLILAAASLPAFSPLAPGSLWPWEKQLDGLVVVDSPEVYTRERLVNDRFMQTTWLLGQLDRYEPAAEFQELSQTIRQRSLTAGLGLSDGGTDATAEAVGGGQSPEGGTTPGASAIDRFRNEQSYRTEVRQAVLETMLDDRHDLQGNTLYMLKFDASIIPPRRIRHRNFAVISVDLERWSASGDGRGLGDDGGGYRTGEDMAPVSDAVAPARAIDPDAELHDVYLNWIEHIRDMVTDEYLNRIRIFLGQKSDEAELVEMWDGMGLNWTPSERDDHLRAAGKGAGAAATDDALETLQQFFHDYQRASGFRSTYRQTLRACSPPPDPGTPAFQDWQRRRNQPASAPLVQAYFTNVTGSSATSRPTLSQRMFEQIRRRILVSAAIAAAGGAAKERRDSELLLAESLEKWLALVEELQRSGYAGGCDAVDGAAQPSWCAELDSVLELGKLGQCKEVLALSERLSSERKIDLDGFFDESTRLYEIATEAWELERFLLFQSLGEYYRQTLDRRLRDLAEFDLVCDGDALLCRVLVNETCPPDEARRDGDDCPLPDAFRSALSPEDAIFFTYAATPKETASSVMAESRDQSAMDLAASAALPGQGDMGGALRAGQSSSVGRVTAGRRVRVMGFAGTGKTDTKPHFGWMIEPPRIGAEAQPVQQSLTAIVSLPSWWQKVRVVVRTCWRGEHGFPEAEVAERRACAEGSAYRNVFTINLPWNVKDINRKLAYDIRRVPFIQSLNGEFGISFPVYHVGQTKARLLIEGGDLWRSTMVTLGSQRASEILVLPNMRGIVATFDVIELPSNPKPCRTEVPIRVWTSEGVTMEDAAKAIIFADEERNRSRQCQGPPPPGATAAATAPAEPAEPAPGQPPGKAPQPEPQPEPQTEPEPAPEDAPGPEAAGTEVAVRDNADAGPGAPSEAGVAADAPASEPGAEPTTP